VEPAVSPPRGRTLSTAFAGLGFVILIVGITYFAMLVLAARYAGPEVRATAYYELGQFLSGQLEWFKDARIYGAVSLLCALVSLLFGLSPLARITIPVAGACYVLLVFFGQQVVALIEGWALRGG
jgi:hypothetical protein